jgi:hypothetical protein
MHAGGRVRHTRRVREKRVQPGAFSQSDVAAIRDTLLASPLVAKSTLAGSFRQTRGFAITFREEGRPTLARRFPELARFVERALSEAEANALASWPDRLRRRAPHPRANGFYLNLLLVGDGGSVGRHTDATLRAPSGVDDAVPVRVSVLYLSVPQQARGGQLRLFRGDRPVGVVRPRPGALVHFRGDLQHEVAPMTAEAGSLRASLVLEQYAFAPDALARLPEFQLHSKAGFDAYLQSHSAR